MRATPHLNWIISTPVISVEEMLHGKKQTEGKRTIVVGAIRCTDGATISVQAGLFNYCIPRNSEGPWTHVEVGYPDPKPSWWADYSYDKDGEVAACVPVDRVRDYIEEHGGETKQAPLLP